MPRAVRDSKIDSRTSRHKLKVAGKPYYRALEPGLHLGYRKGKKGGRWVVRWRDDDAKNPDGTRKSDGYTVETLDPMPDDYEEANGTTVINFTQAQELAREIAGVRRRGVDDFASTRTGPYLVKDAVEDYKADFIQRGGKSISSMEYAINTHILPSLGSKDVEKLNRRHIRNWLTNVAEQPARLRTRKGEDQKFRDISNDPDVIRKRRSTANRVLTILKAALNHAFNEGAVSSNEAWSAVKPFKGVDAPKIRYLSDDEARRLINACPQGLREIVTGALLTGARYSELARMVVSDFDPNSQTVHVALTKSAKPRAVYLTDEGGAFFNNATVGKKASDLIFTHPDGRKWGHAHQTRPMRNACKAARITPAIGFHVLRHTYGSRLAMQGVPMAVIADQLGHADTRITEKHYAHLGPSYVANTVRSALGEFGINTGSNVVGVGGK